MKYKIIALLSQFQQFGMVHRSYGISSVSNAELADHLIANNVIIQKEEPANMRFVDRKGYVLTTQNLPEILADLMNEKGITQKQLAIKSGLSQNTLRRCMDARLCVSHFSLECLLNALDKELVIVDKKESEENGR